MSKNLIEVFGIPQLKDNYSYLIKSNKDVIIIDPAESNSIIKYVEEKDLNIKYILLTHHHSDHTMGVKDILEHTSVPVYSPNPNIKETSVIINNEDILDLKFIEFEVIESPGHTLDHVVFYSKKNNILFSGDLLFRLGCGRVFEGTYLQMFNSLKKINSLSDKTQVYCGHEYTSTNMKFLMKVFPDFINLIDEKKIINQELLEKKSSIPFNLGKEKIINPFLSTKSSYFDNFKKINNYSDIEMFSYLRDLKNNF